MEHYKFSTPPTNLSDCPGSDGRTSRTRVDSGINFPYDVPVEDEDDVSPAYSPSLQYHLIQSSASAKSKIDFAEIFTPPATSTHHLQLPSTIFSSQTFMSDLLPENVVLYCEHCRPTVKSYSGTYARRNLSRHIFQTHSSSDEFPCSVPNCPESFRRTDARLVHERRSHPELERAPAVRRKKSGEE